jgi:hypothetical protein
VLQRRILLDAFQAFEGLWAPGQMICLPYVWDQGDFGERALGRSKGVTER